MTNTNEYRDGTYESYLAARGTKQATLKNIKVNGKTAQQIDFYKAVHPDGTEIYYVGIVFRGHMSDYYGKKTWLEDKYVVTKEEGNEIYIEAKKNREIINEAITTY